jgi:NAD dependent epimerase/dehydratase family enzyme
MFRKVGSGEQYWPWIHVDDAIGALEHCVVARNESGVINVVAPECSKQSEWVSLFRQQRWWPPYQLICPRWLIERAFHERSSLLLEGAKVRARHLSQSNYTYQYPTLSSALQQLMPNRRRQAEFLMAENRRKLEERQKLQATEKQKK